MQDMNKAINWETHYVPLLHQLLKQLDLEVYYLVVDTTDVGQDHRASVLSLAYHKRSLPLIWHVEPGSKGHTTEDVQVALIKRLYAHFQPEDKPVIFLGDSEFDGVQVQCQLKLQDWYYVCRTSPSFYVYPEGEEDGFPIGDLAPELVPHLDSWRTSSSPPNTAMAPFPASAVGKNHTPNLSC